MSWLESYHIPFSWSHSRAGLYDECRRKYYWRYYAPYGGNAPWETGDRILIYTLGRLTTLPMLIGSIIHELARDSLKSAAAGRPWPLAVCVASGRSLLDEGLRRSEKTARKLRVETHRQVTPGKGTVLLDVDYYGEPWSSADRDAALADVTRYAEALCNHPLYQQALSHSDDLAAVDQFDSFHIGDTLAYAVPDAIQRVEEGRLRLVDWKTGRTVAAHLERYSRQLLIYALYAREKWQIDPGAIECWIADLGAGESIAVTVNDDVLRRVESDIASNIADMRATLRDPMRNQAHAADFPMLVPTQEEAAEGAPPAACRCCSYRLVCFGDRSRQWRRDGIAFSPPE